MSFLRSIVRTLWPARCISCGGEPGGETSLCPGCRADLPLLGPACRTCARRLGPRDGSTDARDDCDLCREEPWPVASTRAAFRYEGSARDLVLRMKRRSDGAARSLLARALVAAVTRDPPRPAPEVVVPVPSHPLRSLARGDDAVLGMARQVAGLLDLPLRRGLRRVRSTPLLAGLDRATRAETLEGAIAPRSPVERVGRVVLLVDDVVTTGTTAGACADALHEAGARVVHLASACRTPKRARER